MTFDYYTLGCPPLEIALWSVLKDLFEEELERLLESSFEIRSHGPYCSMGLKSEANRKISVGALMMRYWNAHDFKCTDV